MKSLRNSRWISRDPSGEHSGINLYEYVSDNPIEEFDPLGLCDCAQMKRDIANFQQTDQQLQTMLAYWHSGQTWADYGPSVLSTAAGGRSAGFSKLDSCKQDVVNDMEGNVGFNLGNALQLGIIGGVGYYTLGLHGLFHDTTAEQQWWLTRIIIEDARTRILLQKLQQKYQQECGCKKGGQS